MRLSLISISLQKAEQLWPVRTNVLVCLENLIEFVGLSPLVLRLLNQFYVMYCC